MHKSCCHSVEHHSETSRRSIDRRGIFSSLFASAAALFLGARTSFAQKRLAIGLDKAEKLKSVGGFTILKVQEKDVMFIRETEDKVRALNPICSHQKCLVTYIAETKRIACPCHNSNYDLDGKVLKGPSEKPLQVYDATLDLPKSRIIFTLEE
jgi:Rieske Fe-S protein